MSNEKTVKGTILMFGPSAVLAGMRLLREKDSFWEQYFSDLHDIYPVDNAMSSYSQRQGVEVDLKPVVGTTKDGEEIYFVPVDPCVFKNEPGSLRTRTHYIDIADKTVGIGLAGTYLEDAKLGDVMMPDCAVCSDNLKFQYDGDACELAFPGCSDSTLRRMLGFEYEKSGMKVFDGIRARTVADIAEVNSFRPDHAEEMREQGFASSDMETAWFLMYCNHLRNPRCGAVSLVVSDLPTERPFEENGFFEPVPKVPVEEKYNTIPWQNIDKCVKYSVPVLLE